MLFKATILVLGATLALIEQAEARPQSRVTVCKASPLNVTVPACARPKMRYWMPLGRIDDLAVKRDVARIAAAGFGGLEINSIPADQAPAASEGYAGPEWRKAIRAALVQARKDGISIDLAIGPLYPAAVAEREIGDGAARELVFTSTTVSGTFDGRIALPTGTMPAQLVGLSAMRLVSREGNAAVFAGDSVIDLTARVVDGALRWTAPSHGDWRIVASWARDVGHVIPGAGDRPFVVVDHFGMAGTNRVIANWQHDIFPRLGPDRDALGDVFEDSLHLQGYSLWTNDLLDEFRRRRGYDLRPYLPMVSIGHLNDFFYSIFNRIDLTPRSRPDYDLADGRGARIRDDYYQTLTELYTERHLAPLRRFFASQGLKLRVQPSYGQSLEGTAPVTQVDVPETESFQLDDDIEAYLVQGGAAHVLGKPVYSAECCAMPGLAGKTDWQNARTHVYGLFAGGVNQIVFHGYAQTTPRAVGEPAWVPFKGAFSENYATIVAWGEASRFTASLAREQAMLRAGTPAVDVAILRNSYWDTGHNKIARGMDYWTDQGINAAGLTHDYVTPALLAQPQWTPAGGRAAPAGPAYRAVVVMPGQALPVSALERLVTTAQAGVPVLMVGAAPVPLGLSSDAPFFARTLSKLKATRQVRVLADAGAVSAALGQLGIVSTVTLAGATTIRRVVRRVKKGDYVWLYNPSGSDAEEPAVANVSAVFAIDFASGRKVQIGARKDGNVMWNVSIKAGETTGYFIAR